MAGARRPALWSPEALLDLDGIWNYYARAAGPSTADAVLREIGKTVATITEHPLAGRARDEVHTGLRSVAAHPHIVFYRLASGRPEIVRVLDGRRDIDEIFAEGNS